MPESYRFVVTGRVQGVWFRQGTRQRAQGLGLHGWVRNRTDGAVEGRVHGDEPGALAQFRQWLDHGPPAARVDAVEWRAEEEDRAGGDARGFEVRP